MVIAEVILLVMLACGFLVVSYNVHFDIDKDITEVQNSWAVMNRYDTSKKDGLSNNYHVKKFQRNTSLYVAGWLPSNKKYWTY